MILVDEHDLIDVVDILDELASMHIRVGSGCFSCGSLWPCATTRCVNEARIILDSYKESLSGS